MILASKTRGRGGFTLIEILMAAVAGALILATIYTVFTRAVQLRNSATARTQEIALRVRAANVIRNDLQGAIITGLEQGLASTLEGSPQGTGSQFRGYLRFTTTSARTADTELHGDIQEVEYYIAADAEATDRKAGVLMRVIHNNLLGAVEEVAREEELLRGIEAMEVTFYDGGTWTDSWSWTAPGDPLPLAVKVRLLPAADVTKYAPTGAIEVLVPWKTEPTSTATSTATGTDTGTGMGTGTGTGTGGTGGGTTTP